MARLHMTLDHEVDVLEHQFARNGVQTMVGHRPLHNPPHDRGDADNGDVRLVEGDKVMIAVGTRPYRPADVPFNGTSISGQ